MPTPEGSPSQSAPKVLSTCGVTEAFRATALLLWFPGRNQSIQQAAPQAGLAHPVLAETRILGMSSESPESNAGEALENIVCHEYISLMIWVTPESLQNIKTIAKRTTKMLSVGLVTSRKDSYFGKG